MRVYLLLISDYFLYLVTQWNYERFVSFTVAKLPALTIPQTVPSSSDDSDDQAPSPKSKVLFKYALADLVTYLSVAA